MRLVAEHLVLALPSLPFHLLSPSVVLSRSFLLSRHPHPVRPFLIRSCSINLTSLPTPTPILLFRPSPDLPTSSHQFFDSSLPLPALTFDSILFASLPPNTPPFRATIPNAVYISLRIDRFSSQPILVPIAFWLHQVRNLPLHPHLESSI